MRTTAVSAIALLTLAPAWAQAQAPPSIAPRAFCLWSGRLPACKSFLVSEAHARYRATAAGGGQSRFYLTGELGWMRNLDAAQGVGASAFGGYDWDSEITRGGVKVRYRRWLDGPHQVDLSAGVLLTSAEEGGLGVAAGIGYGLADALLVSIELDYAPAERHLAYDWRCIPETSYTECLLDRATSPTVFLGFGFGRKPGAVAYAVAASLGVIAMGMHK